MTAELHCQAQVTWTGSATGPTNAPGYSREFTCTFDGKPAIVGSADPHFRGDPALHNPEELLLVAVASCRLLSFLALCARERVTVIAYEDHPVGRLEPVNGVLQFTEIRLQPRVVVDDPTHIALAHALHERSRQISFIGRSVNFPIQHDLVVTAALDDAADQDQNALSLD
jgi:organic hydroperoxide reductase OsmC/OhrA